MRKLLALLCCVPVLSCVERTVTAVEVAQIRVEPATFSALVTDTVQLVAVLRDADGHDLPGRTISWSTEDPANATVDAEGRVVARGPGTVRIVAKAEGVTGDAEARIEAPAVIGIELSEARFAANMGGPSLAPLRLSVLNQGADILDGLGTAVRYPPGEATGWLAVSLSSTRAPSEVTLIVSPAGLPRGTFRASLAVSSAKARPRERSVEVMLEVGDSLPAIRLSAATVSFSAIENGSDPPPQTIAVDNGGAGTLASLGTAVTYAANQPAGWLSASIGSTTAPAQLTLAAHVSALPPGTYDATVHVLSGVANSGPQNVTVSLTITPATAAIGLSKTTVTVSAFAGGLDPGDIAVNISNTGTGTLTGLADTVTYGAGQPTGWLTTSLSSVAAPATLLIHAKPISLVPGTYDATIAITAPATANSPQTIGVVFVVRPAILSPAIVLTPATLAFHSLEAGPDPAPDSIAVTNAGGGSLAGLTVAVGYAAGQPTGWLTASLGGAAAPTSVSLQATTDTLSPGTYQATLSVSSPAAPNSPQTAAVTFVVDSAAAAAAIALAPTNLSFNATAGGGAPAAQAVSVANAGGGTLDGLAVSVSYGAGQAMGWISAALDSTAAPAILTVQPATGTLAAGTYDAVVSVSSPVAANSPQDVSVTFVVAAAPVPPAIALDSTAVSFSAATPGPDPAAKAVLVSNSGGGTLDNLAAAVSYSAGQPTGWLVASLDAATAPATLTLAPALGPLTPGSYDATVAISSGVATNSPQAISVTFTVIAEQLPAAPSGLKASVNHGKVDLTWKDNSTNETSFVVERSLASGGPWTGIATLGPDTKSWQDATVAKRTTYYYRIQACNAVGCTVSNVVSART